MSTQLSIFKHNAKAILTYSIIFIVIAIISDSPLLSNVVGVILLAPFQLAIMRKEQNGIPRLIRNILHKKSLQYCALYLSLWIIPVAFSGLLHLIAPSPYVIFPALLAFAVLYAFIAPALYKIATGAKGKRLTFADTVGITASLSVFVSLEFLSNIFHTETPQGALICVSLLSFGFVLTISHQSIITTARNTSATPPQ